MSTLEQLSNSLGESLDGVDPYPDIMSLFIVERWDNRYGIRPASVTMKDEDVWNFNKWCELNIGPYPRTLRQCVKDIREIFPGMSYKDILDGLYPYF